MRRIRVQTIKLQKITFDSFDRLFVLCLTGSVDVSGELLLFNWRIKISSIVKSVINVFTTFWLFAFVHRCDFFILTNFHLVDISIQMPSLSRLVAVQQEIKTIRN